MKVCRAWSVVEIEPPSVNVAPGVQRDVAVGRDDTGVVNDDVIIDRRARRQVDVGATDPHGATAEAGSPPPSRAKVVEREVLEMQRGVRPMR